MFQVGAACYSTPAAALSAAVSSQGGTVVIDGGAAKVLTVTAVTDSAVTYQLTPISGGLPITSTVSITPQPCGLLGTSDALQMGWGVALCWVIVYAVLFLSRPFRGSDTYGNA